jgi:hypothetical protein
LVQVTHVCISDLHAGALTSLLTPLTPGLEWTGVPDDVTDTATCFAQALNATLKPLLHETAPELVLLGDGLDLSLSPPDRSFPVLRSFLGQLYGQDRLLSDRMTYVPGNHDHWLWTEQRFADVHFDKPGFSHVSPAFAQPGEVGRSPKLNGLLNELGVSVALYYPNHGLVPAKGVADGERAIVFHHGHFVEPMYRLMSDLLGLLSGRPIGAQSCEELEICNGAWIDFGWSTLGDAGLLGKDAAAAYQILLTGGASEALHLRAAAVLKDRMASLLGLPSTPVAEAGLDVVSRGLVDALIGKLSQLERYDYTQHLSPSSIAGLRSYLSGAVLAQMAEELDPSSLPKHTTFIFGHTHKPFEDQLVVAGFPQPVSIYNTGGWILDTSLLGTVEGASVVFVDDQLNTAALRLFSPPVNGCMAGVKVVTADPSPGKSDLVTALEGAVEANKGLWDRFSDAARQDYEQRQSLILKMADDTLAQAGQSGGLV